MNTGERRTKIVCTLGPSSNTKEQIDELVHSGMNMARINFSHGTHEENGRVIQNVHAIAEKYDISLPVLADLQGPNIRVGLMKDGGQYVSEIDYITLPPVDITGTSARIPVDYPNLVQDASAGNRI